MLSLWQTLLYSSAVILLALPAVAQSSASPDAVSLADLQSAAAEPGGAIRSFQADGLVCAVVRDRRTLVLQDKTATILLELPVVPAEIGAGDRVVVRGTNCSIVRSRFGIQISSTVVNNDHRHSALLKTGRVFLETGYQPIRLEWFNGLEDSALDLEYAGPSVLRQTIPGSLLWRKPKSGAIPAQLQTGLDFAAYNGDWSFLPDFASLTPVATGVATNFSLAYSARKELTGLVFDGFIRIGSAGVYTFYLMSDDGSRLDVGCPEVSCAVVKDASRSVPVPEKLEEALVDRSRHHWVESRGKVTFAGESQENLVLDLEERGSHLPVTVIGGSALLSSNLLDRQIRVEGICKFANEGGEWKFGGLVVPSVEQTEICPWAGENAASFSTNDLLTTALQVRRLKPELARMRIPARITGAVIAASPISLVLQDASGGIYIHYSAGNSFDQPVVGQLWEVEGRTDAGDFSPIIRADMGKFLGSVAMPEPIRPTRDQLMNGSLDAEYVEIRGVVTSVSNTEMSLLTPDGSVTLRGNDERPLPQVSASGLAGAVPVGDIVRIRGCFATDWNLQTKQVKSGTFFLSASTVEVEELPPSDPFSLPTTRAAEFLLFNARAGSLQRVKIAGAVIHVHQGEYFLLDGRTGVRVLAAPSQPLHPGDLIEAEGFPSLSGSGLILQEAQIRNNGHASLPEAVKVSADDLPNQKYYSTLVEVQAVVISDAVQRDQRVLELQTGPHHFPASLSGKREFSSPLLRGSRLQLTGVYSSAREFEGDNLDPFELLLNSPADILVLQQPTWWTVRRAISAAAILAGGLGITMIWILLLRRTVEERTAQLQNEIEERQRVEQHRLMEQERTRVAQDLHDELGTGLTQVALLGSLAKNPSLPTERKSLYLDQLSEAARALVTGLDEIVWAVNPKYDSVSSLASYFALFSQRFLNLAGIACRFDAAKNLEDHPLDARLRHSIFLAFKEALNNVVRHSRATEVQLKIDVISNELMISITDNGGGFAVNSDSPGSDGIAGMQHRMEGLGGRCVINSNLGSGTTVKISLPLKRLTS